MDKFNNANLYRMRVHGYGNNITDYHVVSSQINAICRNFDQLDSAIAYEMLAKLYSSRCNFHYKYFAQLAQKHNLHEHPLRMDLYYQKEYGCFGSLQYHESENGWLGVLKYRHERLGIKGFYQIPQDFIIGGYKIRSDYFKHPEHVKSMVKRFKAENISYYDKSKSKTWMSDNRIYLHILREKLRYFILKKMARLNPPKYRERDQDHDFPFENIKGLFDMECLCEDFLNQHMKVTKISEIKGLEADVDCYINPVFSSRFILSSVKNYTKPEETKNAKK